MLSFIKIIFTKQIYRFLFLFFPLSFPIQSNAQAIRVTDFRNVELVFEKPAERIVCLLESALTGLYMLRAEDRIVGVSTAVYQEHAAPQYAALDHRLRTKQIPAPGNWDFVNIESVVALRPDLVIIWAQQNESILSLEEKGISVYAVDLDRFTDITKSIQDMGMLTDTQSRAEEMINHTREEMQRFSDILQIPEKQKKRVYFMWPQGLLETSGTNSTLQELLTLAGAKNVCSLPLEHCVINLEMLLAWNPDMIVMWTNSALDPIDILSLKHWQHIKAIQNNHVFELPSAFFCDFWTLKYQYAVKLIAVWCYPEKFRDFDLKEEKRKMLLALYGEKGLRLLE